MLGSKNKHYQLALLLGFRTMEYLVSAGSKSEQLFNSCFEAVIALFMVVNHDNKFMLALL
jgi:hypothetical protein